MIPATPAQSKSAERIELEERVRLAAANYRRTREGYGGWVAANVALEALLQSEFERAAAK
jgi:hypothetical protein